MKNSTLKLAATKEKSFLQISVSPLMKNRNVI
jgi:hypothetical protein